MAQRPPWLFSSGDSDTGPTELAAYRAGTGSDLEGQTVVVPVSRWGAYLEALDRMGVGPARVVLYMDVDVPEPSAAWELVDVVVARGDAAALARAVAGQTDVLVDRMADLSNEVLRALVQGEAPERIGVLEGNDVDEEQAIIIRRAARLELALRGLHPLGGVVTAQVPDNVAAASLVAAVILVGWLRAGLRPRPGPALRGETGDVEVAPEDVEAALDAGHSLEGTLGTASLTFSFAADTPEGPALIVTADSEGLTLAVQRGGETVSRTPLHPSLTRLPLSLLQQGDRVVISPLHAAP